MPEDACPAGGMHLAGSISALKDPVSSMLASYALDLTTPPGPGVLGNTDLSADNQDMPGQGRFFISIVHFYIALINILDVHINSPPSSQFESQGASRTTGGVFQGRAYSNNFNQADFAKASFGPRAHTSCVWKWGDEGQFSVWVRSLCHWYTHHLDKECNSLDQMP